MGCLVINIGRGHIEDTGVWEAEQVHCTGRGDRCISVMIWRRDKTKGSMRFKWIVCVSLILRVSSYFLHVDFFSTCDFNSHCINK